VCDDVRVGVVCCITGVVHWRFHFTTPKANFKPTLPTARAREGRQAMEEAPVECGGLAGVPVELQQLIVFELLRHKGALYSASLTCRLWHHLGCLGPDPSPSSLMATYTDAHNDLSLCRGTGVAAVRHRAVAGLTVYWAAIGGTNPEGVACAAVVHLGASCPCGARKREASLL
jgi:hypothetical protein